MRKWQRDRGRRRKPKSSSPAQAGPQAEPLQPAYPDMDRTFESPEPESPPEQAAPPAEEAQAPDRTRRRRRRGGGGGRRAAKSAEPPAAAELPPPETAASEIAPELPAAAAPLEPRPPQPVHRPPRAPRGVVVLAIGLPGSGKSSWFKRRGVTPLSSDLLRSILFDDIAEQRYQDLVFGTLRSLLRARLIARMPWNYVDATNLSPKERHGWIKMAREFGYEAHAVFFDVPLDVCMERNRKRSRLVPEEVMHRMAAKLRPPSFEEGFSKVIVVRVKKKEEPGAEAENTEEQAD